MFDKNDSLRQTYQFPMKKFAMLKAINRILLMKIKIKDVHMMKVHYEMIEQLMMTGEQVYSIVPYVVQ
jgi:hypothetical protein